MSDLRPPKKWSNITRLEMYRVCQDLESANAELTAENDELKQKRKDETAAWLRENADPYLRAHVAALTARLAEAESVIRFVVAKCYCHDEIQSAAYEWLKKYGAPTDDR